MTLYLLSSFYHVRSVNLHLSLYILLRSINIYVIKWLLAYEIKSEQLFARLLDNILDKRHCYIRLCLFIIVILFMNIAFTF